MRGRVILLVEDDAAIATVIRVALTGEGAVVDAVDTLAGRDRALRERQYDAMITDVILPDGNGLDGLTQRTAAGAMPPIIVLSAQNTLDTAVRANEAGALDYLPKPFDLDELLHAVRAATERVPSALADIHLDDVSDPKMPIIGRAAAMQDVYRIIARVAPTDLSVLVLGESGTGKELVAQAIHRSSQRRDRPFVAINMAAIPRELIEAELFGHEKGAFTGATIRSSGRFEQAQGGTLFLDEIGDMPIEAQTRLLRVLQDGDYTPIGASRSTRADVRVIAATNQDLTSAVAAGRFREDLYYRLNVIPISLPPLSDRRSDIGPLARHFLTQATSAGLPQKSLSEAALAMLTGYHWPGNVRELQNSMQRLALLTRSERIEDRDVRQILDRGAGSPASARAADDGAPDPLLVVALRAWIAARIGDAAASADSAIAGGDSLTLHGELVGLVERELIEAALSATDGNQLRAAALLGINRNTLRIKRGPAND
jgi:two-component system, NtrC family, nitrogen regulation response regulator GlnG